MNRLINLFHSPKKDILNLYFTAGFPNLNETVSTMVSLEKAGVDIIELGIPFSDPLADGPIIQQSSEVALANGMTLDVLFAQLQSFRNQVNLPVILMGYLNPIMQYGVEKFISKAKEVGIDGLILPDVPPLEFEKHWKESLEKANMSFSFLVTPETKEERVRYLDSLSSGFLYAVSSSSTTGNSSGESGIESAAPYLNRLKSYQLKNPVLAGFGIKSAEDYQFVNSIVDGAIIGSAFIKHIGANGASEHVVSDYIKSIKLVP